jgi:hypothetical protein|tara:strand:- start:2910 stop:3095 length:186 start_codon:yes stop_codon:yes gene_type:complete
MASSPLIAIALEASVGENLKNTSNCSALEAAYKKVTAATATAGKVNSSPSTSPLLLALPIP